MRPGCAWTAPFMPSTGAQLVTTWIFNTLLGECNCCTVLSDTVPVTTLQYWWCTASHHFCHDLETCFLIISLLLLPLFCPVTRLQYSSKEPPVQNFWKEIIMVERSAARYCRTNMNWSQLARNTRVHSKIRTPAIAVYCIRALRFCDRGKFTFYAEIFNWFTFKKRGGS